AGSVRNRSAAVEIPNAMLELASATGQPPRPASQPHVRQNAACDSAPAIAPVAAAAANSGPWLSARKRVIGAEFIGQPTNHPPTAGPKRRPARLAAPISAGVRTTLTRSVSNIDLGRSGVACATGTRPTSARRFASGESSLHPPGALAGRHVHRVF